MQRPIFRRCRVCGTGRISPSLHGFVHIPTCDVCGSQWIDTKTAKEMDVILKSPIIRTYYYVHDNYDDWPYSAEYPAHVWAELACYRAQLSYEDDVNWLIRGISRLMSGLRPRFEVREVQRVEYPSSEVEEFYKRIEGEE